MTLTRKDAEIIAIEVIAGRRPPLASRKGRDLFWFRLQDVQLIWVYMLDKNALASVWWDEDRWRYSIPIHNRQGSEEYQIDAWKAVEGALADDDNLDELE